MLEKRLKKIGEEIKIHVDTCKFTYNSFNVYFQDESRFGLFTRNGKALTAKGVKPVCPFVQDFRNTYLYGAFSPINGDSFILELPECNSDLFQIYLDEFAKEKPSEYKVVFLDNGAFHKAKKLNIPANIGLVFIPPYSPELNPAEKMWAALKKPLTNKAFKSLEELQTALDKIIKEVVQPHTVKSTTAFACYMEKIFEQISC